MTDREMLAWLLGVLTLAGKQDGLTRASCANMAEGMRTYFYKEKSK